MSERDQTLMRTRCPECGTVFRVTSEQLRRKAGKVRCGQCQAVFNAFDHWLSEAADETLVAEPISDLAAPPLTMDAGESPATTSEPETVAVSEVVAEPLPAADDSLSDVPADTRGGEEAGTEPLLPVEPIPELVRPDAWLEETLVAHSIAVPDANATAAPGSSEEPTQAARAAGLVAARDMMELSGHNRWSAGTLASDGLGGFAGEEPRRATWPFVVVAVLLLLALLGQVFHYFRTDIALRMPATAAAYDLLGVAIPLPRNPALVSIETSDLQSDNARGLFVLQATLKNRAAHPQAWPALELSLTDTNDAVVARRVMYAAEYLPPGTTSDAFPSNAEIPVKLWIEARDIGASGYRLYIFYP